MSSAPPAWTGASVMPTYEYRCPNGHEFELFEKVTASKARVKCPTCGKMAERQISGGAGLLFKGSGFYITDYKKASGGGKAPESKKAETKKPDSASKPKAKE